MTFFITLIFVFLFYVIPLYKVMIRDVLIFPVLGPEGSWLLTAGFIYIFLALGAQTLKQFEEVILPGLPRWRHELTRRTGIYRLDGFGFKLSFLSTILFLSTDAALVPLGLASSIGFASLRRQKMLFRDVRGVRGTDQSTSEKKDDAAETAKEPVARRYVWKTREALDQPYDGAIELTIDRRRYQEFVAANPYKEGRPVVRNYELLVTEGITDELKNLAHNLRDISSEQGFSSYQELACILSFIQAIPYAADQETKGREYVRWPVETLYDMVGDSNCKSVLLASLLHALEYEVIIIESKGRTAVGVAGAEGLPGRFLTYEGQRYYYCETSTSDWRIGQLPPDLAEGQFRVYPVKRENGESKMENGSRAENGEEENGK